MRVISFILVFLVYWSPNADICWAQKSDNLGLNLEAASNLVQEFDPNIGPDQWRLIPYIGWRKFAPVDAYYYDWIKYKSVTRWRWWRNNW